MLASVVVLVLVLPTPAVTGEAANASRVLQTENYRIHSELPADLTRELADELEKCHADYSRRLGSFAIESTNGVRGKVNRSAITMADSDGRYAVHLFSTQAGYETFTGGAVVNSAGAFHPGKRSLCAFLEGQGRGEIKQTLRHEAFHQFAYEHLGAGVPVWVNEGLAQVFEYGVRVGDELLMGQVPTGPLHEVQAAIKGGKLIDFHELLSLDDRGWSRRMADRSYGGLMYAQSWAMVHFLVYAADADGVPIYRGLFNAFLADIAAGETARTAFPKHFGTNLDGFRARFEQYVQALQPTGVAEMLDRQDVLARMLILLHGRGMSFDQMEQFREYVRRYGIVLHRTRNGVTWSTEADPGVYFVDTRGVWLDDRRLRFVIDPAGELPSLVRRPGDGLVYRTQFYRQDGALQHETLCERE